MIVSDLVLVRERAKFLGLRIAIATILTIIGPVLGGILAEQSWRWVFFINLPFPGIALLIMAKALARVDFIGSIVFVASISGVLFGLISGATQYPWSWWHIIVPLVLGFAGWVLFHHLSSVTPLQGAQYTTSALWNSDFGCLPRFGIHLQRVTGVVVYLLPIYFQSLKGASPLMSGVDVLPFSVFYVPLAVITGGLMSKAEWVCFQLLLAIGAGLTLTSILPVIQASLPESYVATATATFAFVRNFGFVWVVTVPSVIFNSQVDRNLNWFQDQGVRDQLSNGAAYGYACTGAINGLAADVRVQVENVYGSALKALWQAAAAMAAVGCLLVL
ncbi:hypothetical protein GGR54DRAFT_650764 [Hypoxylon sp. NC1633]|nr:hypothetical protein GGR54DRAFT_650764 [Hypoxylon sp. NC1633]